MDELLLRGWSLVEEIFKMKGMSCFCGVVSCRGDF